MCGNYALRQFKELEESNIDAAMRYERDLYRTLPDEMSLLLQSIWAEIDKILLR